MNDLISRQAAIDACHNYEDGKDAYAYGDVVEKRLKTLPSAQPSAQPEQRWIPVECKPPKERNRYWVCTDTGYQCECRWTNNVYGLGDSDEWGWSIFDVPQYTKVVAYMPLPEPYKGGAE